MVLGAGLGGCRPHAQPGTPLVPVDSPPTQTPVSGRTAVPLGSPSEPPASLWHGPPAPDAPRQDLRLCPQTQEALLLKARWGPGCRVTPADGRLSSGSLLDTESAACGNGNELFTRSASHCVSLFFTSFHFHSIFPSVIHHVCRASLSAGDAVVMRQTPGLLELPSQWGRQSGCPVHPSYLHVVP